MYLGKNINGKTADYNYGWIIVNPPSVNCNDGIQNGNETGIDCGGVCEPCETNPPIVSTGPNNPSVPTATAPNNTITYTPTNASDLSSAANVNKIAIISNSFNAANVTFSGGQTIRPAGGVITGLNINLNGAFIEENNSQAFAPTTRFTNIYDKSRLKPDTFGGFGNDAIDDASAIDALVENSSFGGVRTNGVYIKNSPSRYTRQGLFNWHVTTAEVEVTSNTNFRINTFDVDYLFDFENLSVEIIGGKFNGNNVYGRCFWNRGQPKVYYANNEIYDWNSTSNARGIAIKLDIYPTSKGYTLGEFYNNTIDNISSDTDGIANNVNGLSKGFYFSVYENGNTNTYLEGNTVTNILGDDAEALYISPASGTLSHTNNNQYFLTNETYKFAKRRQIKITVSNVHIKDSWFETPTVTQDFNGQAAVALGIFSTHSNGELNKNFTIENCDIIQHSANQQSGLDLTEMDSPVVINNRFVNDNISNYKSLGMGGGFAGYLGVVKSPVINNNTFTNGGIEFGELVDTDGTTIVLEDNIFNYTYNASNSTPAFNPGLHVGVLRYLSYQGQDYNHPVIFRNSTINYTASSTFTLWMGLICSISGDIQNLTVDNVTMNYSLTNGASVGAVLGKISTNASYPANFGSTNTIKDVTITGLSGTNALQITGAVKNPLIQGSFGDNNTAITVQ